MLDRPPRGPTDATLRAAAEAATKRRQAASALLAATMRDSQSPESASETSMSREEALRELAGLAEQMAGRLAAQESTEAEPTSPASANVTRKKDLVGPAEGPYEPTKEPLLKL